MGFAVLIGVVSFMVNGLIGKCYMNRSIMKYNNVCSNTWLTLVVVHMIEFSGNIFSDLMWPMLNTYHLRK
jgi:hypothetical protein